MFRDILVGIDGSPSSRRALEHAADLARAGNAKLTLITVAPPVASYVTLAGVSIEEMRAELDEWARRLLEKAAALLPDGVVAHRVQKTGSAGPRIVEEIERGTYDLVVLGSRGRGRAQEGLLGSVNGYVHFHAKVPLLSVPERDGGEPIDVAVGDEAE
jgi:nucleotide-binding universal stress UspA family protein